jgi:glutathione S-transferase
MQSRPAVEKGRDIPTPGPRRETDNDPEVLKKRAQEGRAWVQSGMAADAKAHGKSKV